MKCLMIILSLFVLSSCGSKNANVNKMPGLNTDVNTSPLNPKTRNCVTQPANSTAGYERSLDEGVTWGSCTGFVCDAGHMENAGTCIAAVLTAEMNPTDESSSGYNSFFTDKDNIVTGTCVPYKQVDFKLTYNNLASTLFTYSVNCSAGGTFTVTFLRSAIQHLPYETYSNYNLEIFQGSNNTSYLKIPLNKVSTTRSCAINNGTGTQNYVNNGTYTSCVLSSCNTGYTSNGSACIIDTHTLTLTKLTNQATATDITLGRLSSGLTDTSVTESYDYGQMIVIEATPAAGYTITGWTGCDTVSGSFDRCTISSLTADRTITPTIVATSQVLTFAWSNASVGAVATGYTITKNGSSCSGSCLNSIILTDIIKVTVTPGSYLEDVSSFGLTGSTSSVDTSVTNEVTFTMGTQNVTVTANIIDKDIVVTDALRIGMFYDRTTYTDLTELSSSPSSLIYNSYFSTSGDIRFYFGNYDAYFSNDRTIHIYGDATCTNELGTVNSQGSGSNIYYNISYTPNTTNEYSIKLTNVTKESSCYVRRGFHLNSITKTVETFIPNEAIETNNGYKSFLVDTTNTLSGVCRSAATDGNPALNTYNYGHAEFVSNAISVVAKAYTNSDLVNPIYTQTQNTNCSGSSDYSLTFTQNANFVSADVIKYTVTLKNYFGAKYTEDITLVKNYQTRSCAITNGTGTQDYISNGTYTTCTVSSCDATYTQSGNTCVAAPSSRACTSQPTNSTGGTETTSDGGVTWSACTGFTCNNGYYVNGASCSETTAMRITAGKYQSCGIDTNGNGYCWGYNYSGELGDNSTTQRNSPVAINTSGVLSGLTLKEIYTTESASCAIASDDKVYCWGYGPDGALGDGLGTNSSVPKAVNWSGVLNGLTAKQLTMGSGHTCIVASNDEAYCWGYNAYGQVYTNNPTNRQSPVAIDKSGVLAGKTIKYISGGYENTCVIASDDNVYCWGLNDKGQLGNASNTNSNVAVAVNKTGVLSGKTVKKLSSKQGNHSCVIASDDKIYCWGDNYYGQLGNDNYGVDSNIPVAVNTTGVLSGKTMVDVYTGTYATCAKDSNDLVYCWGRNTYGQLGDGTSGADSDIPVAVNTTGALSGKKILKVSLGWLHTCATTTESKMYCWGGSQFGQLGSGNTTESDMAQIIDSVLSFY